MRRCVLTALAVLGVAAALTVTASSTTHVAYAAGMRGLALGAVVVVLEVVNVVGTWSWITEPRTHVRVESAAAVACASTVTSWCGVLTFGPMGLVAPVGLLAAVHGVSRMWTRLPGDVTAQTTPDLPDVPEIPTLAAARDGHAETSNDGVDDVAASVVDERVRTLVEDLAAGVEVTGPLAAGRFGVSERTARRLLADARTHLDTSGRGARPALRSVGVSP